MNDKDKEHFLKVIKNEECKYNVKIESNKNTQKLSPIYKKSNIKWNYNVFNCTASIFLHFFNNRKAVIYNS